MYHMIFRKSFDIAACVRVYVDVCCVCTRMCVMYLRACVCVCVCVCMCGRGKCSIPLSLIPSHEERGLVTIEQSLGCAESAVVILNNPKNWNSTM